MKIERELLKGVLPIAVMRLLNRRAMYGYELITRLEGESDGVLKLGQSTLYPLLYNLQSQGLLEAHWQTENGRKRKYYQLTDDGQRRLVDDEAQWRHLVHGMGKLVNALRLAPRLAS